MLLPDHSTDKFMFLQNTKNTQMYICIGNSTILSTIIPSSEGYSPLVSTEVNIMMLVKTGPRRGIGGQWPGCGDWVVEAVDWGR